MSGRLLRLPFHVLRAFEAVLLFVLGTTQAAAADCPGQKASDPRKIVFDAASNTFTCSPSTLTPQDQVLVTLTNVDTLRNSYQFQGKQISFMPAVPAALASIFLLAPEQSSNVPAESGLRSFEASMREYKTAASTKRKGIIESPEFTKVKASFSAMNDGYTPLLTKLRTAIAREDDLHRLALEPMPNLQRRHRACPIAAKWPKPNESSPAEGPAAPASSTLQCPETEADLDEGARRASLQIAAGIPKTFSEVQLGLDEKYYTFVSSTSRWTEAHATDTDDAERKAVEAIGKAAESLHDSVLKALPGIELRYSEASNLLSVIMDRDRTPAALERTISRVSFDEIQVVVGVQPLPLPAGALGTAVPQPPTAASDFTTQSMRIPVVGCCRVGISLGLVGTGLASHHYYITPAADPSSKSVVSEGPKDTLDLSPAALVHFENYLSPHFAAGFAVGLTTSSPIRTLFGGSLSWGRRVRGTLTGGLAVGSITELNGDTVGATPILSTGVSTASVIKASWFAGLSGSFTIP